MSRFAPKDKQLAHGKELALLPRLAISRLIYKKYPLYLFCSHWSLFPIMLLLLPKK